MTISKALLAEFDQEMANTRKTLERVPDGKFAWKPHEKSMPLGNLAVHVATLPSWAVQTVNQDSLDLAPEGGEPFKLRHKDANLAWRVRVKSGYLADARSLAGFIQMPDGRMRVFTIILNGDSKEDDIWDQVSRWAN